jgi:hypothetical protein
VCYGERSESCRQLSGLNCPSNEQMTDETTDLPYLNAASLFDSKLFTLMLCVSFFIGRDLAFDGLHAYRIGQLVRIEIAHHDSSRND